MIISRTPLRISFFGGGTDYTEFYEQHGGEVLVTSIDKYSYITIKSIPLLFDYKFKVSYSKLETVENVEDIQHPAVRECLKFMKVDHPLEIAYVGDLPARTGLGTSSSFTVGLLNALYALQKKKVSNEQLGNEAIYVEQKLIKERVGSQDQMSTAVGGFNHIVFEKNKITINPVKISGGRLNELHKNLLLFYTGITRHAHQVVEEQVKNTKEKKNDDSLFQMKAIVKKSIDILSSSKNIDDFGALLHETWKLKKTLSSSVSNSTIDEAYNKAMSAGALGGKLLGAGGGGFLLIYAPEKHHDKIKKALTDLRHVPFNFDDSGSRIIYSDK